MNKKIYYIVGIVIVLVLILTGYGVDTEQTKTESTFKIGVILPLTGPGATMGEATKKSIDLAMSKLSDKDLARIEIIIGDDQLDPKQTVSVAQKLIDTDKVGALIVYSSPSSVAASYIAEKSGVPMIGLGNSSEITAKKEWVIRYMLGPQAQAKEIVEKLIENKYKKVAIIWNQSDGPKSVHDELVSILNQGGYNLVADESVTKGENDFKTSITKIKAAKPEVVIAYISPQVGVFARQAKELGLNTPIVSGPPLDIIEQIKAAQGGLDNQEFVSADNINFLNEYFSKYGSYPTVAGDYMYDAINQIVNASYESVGNGGELMKLLKRDFSGVAGQYKYNGDGSFNLKQIVKIWDGAKFVKVR